MSSTISSIETQQQPHNWRRYGAVIACCLTFAFLLTTRFTKLGEPPYYEQAEGLWSEGAYLAETRLDYAALSKETHGLQGGVRCYFVSSVLPAVVALLLLATNNSSDAFALYHLLTFAATGITVGALYSLLRREVARGLAALSCALLLSFPFFSVQVDMLGMDMPMTALAMWSIAMFANGRYIASAAMALLAIWVKNSALVLIVAQVACLASMTLIAPRTDRAAERFQVFGGLLLSLFNIGVVAVLLWFRDAATDSIGFDWISDGQLLLRSSPEFLLAIAVSLYLAFRNALEFGFRGPNNQGTFPRRVFMLLPTWVQYQPVVALVSVTVLAHMAAQSRMPFEVRYFTLIAPLVVLLICQLGFARLRSAKLAYALIAAWIIVNLINRSGLLYPEMPVWLSRAYGVPERSHEYERDLNSYRASCRLLQREYRDEAMLLSDQYLRLTSRPVLGFVTQALRTVSQARLFRAYDDNLLSLLRDEPDELIVAMVPNPLAEVPFPYYQVARPTPADTVIYDDGLRPPVQLYRRRFAQPRGSAGRFREVMDVLFANATSMDCAVRLAAIGQPELAMEYVRRDLQLTSLTPEAEASFAQRIEDDITGDAITEESLHASSDYVAALVEHLRCYREQLLRAGDQWRNQDKLRERFAGGQMLEVQRLRYLPPMNESTIDDGPRAAISIPLTNLLYRTKTELSDH